MVKTRMNHRPVSEEWLRQKYLDERLHCTQIAAIVQRDAKTVWTWLRDCGIPTRPRGANKAVQFKPGMSTFLGKRHTQETKDKIRALRLGDGHFPKQPNGAAWWSGRTGPDHPKWAGGATPERQAFYATEEWAAARHATFVRTSGRCEKCQSLDDLHIHHVWPFIFSRLRAVPANLRVLCAPCHRWVHSKSNGDRDFLPPFGTFPLTINGTTRFIRISYRPTFKGRVPIWLTSN